MSARRPLPPVDGDRHASRIASALGLAAARDESGCGWILYQPDDTGRSAPVVALIGLNQSGRLTRIDADPGWVDKITIEGIRARVAAAPASHKCYAECPGWIISDAGEGPEIERCDECRTIVTDQHASLLPEAQAALTAARGTVAP